MGKAVTATQIAATRLRPDLNRIIVSFMAYLTYLAPLRLAHQSGPDPAEAIDQRDPAEDRNCCRWTDSAARFHFRPAIPTIAGTTPAQGSRAERFLRLCK